MREHGIAEARAPRDEPAVLGMQLDRVHDDPRPEPRGERSRDVGCEHARAQQDDVVRARCEHARERIDHRLRQRLGQRLVVADEDRAGAVAAERSHAAIVEPLPADHGVDLHAQLGGQPRRLLQQAERARADRALVLLAEDEEVAHQIAFRSSRNARISSAELPLSSSMRLPPSFVGGGVSASTSVVAPPSTPSSASESWFWGFLRAPMIALSDA